VGAIDERLGEVELAAITQVGSEPPKKALEHAVLDPGLKPSVTRRRRRIPTGEIGPRRAGAQDPQHAVDDIARISPRSAALLRGAFPLARREAAFDRIPLLVREVHPHL
jgi:hypothetical protein